MYFCKTVTLGNPIQYEQNINIPSLSSDYDPMGRVMSWDCSVLWRMLGSVPDLYP